MAAPPGASKPNAAPGAASPFHAGERAVQERLGVRDRVEQMGRRLVRDFMPDEHRQFFAELPFLLVGSSDPQGRLWASLLSAGPGFARAPSSRSLRVSAVPFAADPLALSLRPGAPLGLLGIELATRRRNRVNGRIAQLGRGWFELEVDQSFGNCKQYIHARAGWFRSPEETASPLVEGPALSARARSILERADTTFIATSSPHAAEGGALGVDISHRGGRPGFVRVNDASAATRLTLPDFRGNFMFNSFGNLELNPRAGLLAIDFTGGDLLSLTGKARVIWDGPQVAAFAGAERLLELDVEAGLLWPGVAEGWTSR